MTGKLKSLLITTIQANGLMSPSNNPRENETEDYNYSSDVRHVDNNFGPKVVSLDDNQQRAVDSVMRSLRNENEGSHVLALHGSPGSGKTFTLSMIVVAVSDMNIKLSPASKSISLHMVSQTHLATVEAARMILLARNYPNGHVIITGSEKLLQLPPEMAALHLDSCAHRLMVGLPNWMKHLRDLETLLSGNHSFNLEESLGKCILYGTIIHNDMPSSLLSKDMREVLSTAVTAMKSSMGSDSQSTQNEPTHLPLSNIRQLRLAFSQICTTFPDPDDLRKIIVNEASIVLSTASRHENPALRGKIFDVSIIDDCNRRLRRAADTHAKYLILAGRNSKILEHITRTSRRNSVSTVQLHRQYRMHPAVSQWSTKHFCDGLVSHADAVLTSPLVRTWHSLVPPLSFHFVSGVVEYSDSARSYFNRNEAAAVVTAVVNFNSLLSSASGHYLRGVKSDLDFTYSTLPIKVCIASPSRAQTNRINALMRAYERAHPLLNLSVECRTIHQCEGLQCDVCFFSCVRTELFNFQPWLLNVAITRAKLSLVVIGDQSSMKRNEVLSDMMNSFVNSPDSSVNFIFHRI